MVNYKELSIICMLLVITPLVQGQDYIFQTGETYTEEYPRTYTESYYTPTLTDETPYCEENCKEEKELSNSCSNSYCCLDKDYFLYNARCTTGGFVDGEFYPGIQLRVQQEKDVTGEPLSTQNGISKRGTERKINTTISAEKDPSSPCHLPLGTTVTIENQGEFTQHVVEDHHEDTLRNSCILKVFKGKENGDPKNRQETDKVYVTSLPEETSKEEQPVGGITGAYYYKKDISNLVTFIAEVKNTLDKGQQCSGSKIQKEDCLKDIFDSNNIDDGFYCEDVDPIDQPVPTQQEESEEEPEEILPEPEDIPSINLEGVGPRIIENSDSIQNGQRFWEETKQVADELNTDPNNLPIIMLVETGVNGKIDHTVINERGCAGLIQFCPWGGIKTLQQETGDNTITNTSIADKTAFEQLEYVELYLKSVMPNNIDKEVPLETLYLYVLYPSAVNAERTEILNPGQDHSLDKQANYLYGPNGAMTKLSIRAGLLKQAGVDEADNIPIPSQEEQDQRQRADTDPTQTSPVFDPEQYTQSQIKRVAEKHILNVASCKTATNTPCVCETGIIPRAEITPTYISPRTNTVQQTQFIPHNIEFRTGLSLSVETNKDIIPLLDTTTSNPRGFLQSLLSNQIKNEEKTFYTQLNRESYYYIDEDKAYLLPSQPLWYNETNTENNNVLENLNKKNEDVTRTDLIPTCQPQKQHFTYCAYPPSRDGVETTPLTYTLQT